MLWSRGFILVAALSGLIAVGIGAMGSHSLPKTLADKGLTELEVAKKLGQCEIAVRYQMYHTLAILGLALAPAFRGRSLWKVSCVVFLIGILLFSGGLYSMVFFNVMGHWSIVPLGGSCLMLGWLLLGIGSLIPGKSDTAPGTSD